MNATYTFKIRPRDAVPTEGRAAWIERFGVLPNEATLTIEAPLKLWERAGAVITPDGCVLQPNSYVSRNPMVYLERTALARIGATGQVPESLSASLLEDYAREEEDRRAKIEAAERETAEEQRATQEARIDAMLAETNEQWLARSVDGEPKLPSIPTGLSSSDLLHPRIEARMVEVRAYLDAEMARYEARKEACRTAIVEYAKRYDDLARPATEGYAVARATLDRIAEDLRASIPIDAAHSAIDSQAWKDPDERAAPRPEAFTLLDQVTRAARAAELPPAIGRWEVSRIVRIDVCPHSGEKHVVTAVLATLRTPIGVREITCSTEPLACSHEVMS